MAATVKVLKKPKRTFTEQTYVAPIASGLAFTMKRFFENIILPDPDGSSGRKNKIATIRYARKEKDGAYDWVAAPEESRIYPERFRGVHRLTHRTDHSPRCVACLCCSTACPAQCIHIEPAEYDVSDARYGYERYPAVFVIDELRCIFCGYCVEACPCDAIRMDTGIHMPPSTARADFLYDKETLMSMPGKDGTYMSENPRHEPGDPSHPGIDRERGH